MPRIYKHKYDYEEAGQLRRAGFTNKEISAKLGVSTASINVVLGRSGIKRGIRPTVKAILDLHNLGDKPAVIAHKLNIHYQRVINTLHVNGLSGPRAGERAPRRRAARILKDAGLTYSEIGEAFGVSRQRAQQLVRPTETERTKIHLEHGGKCDKCGETGVKLDQHHTDYKAGPSQLLCTSCHLASHGAVAIYESSQKEG